MRIYHTLNIFLTVVDVDVCEVDSPCMNGGSCQDLEYDFNCTCPEYYVGHTCEGITLYLKALLSSEYIIK